jgi:hypothetical protein
MEFVKLTDISFNVVQTFYIDKEFFKGAKEVGLTKINLYFKQKPTRTRNHSGLYGPGVTLYLCPVNKSNNLPDLNKMIKDGFARCEWEEIIPSKDATISTSFHFEEPVEVDTEASYAIVVKYDGDEDFELWTSKEGQVLVGTNNKTAGPAGQYIGKYYEYSTEVGPGSANHGLRALNDTDLKFDVYGAKYTENFTTITVTNTATGQTHSVPNGQFTFVIPSKNYEFFTYELTTSQNLDRIKSGDYVFQNTVFQTGTLHINAHSIIVNGSVGVNFNNLFDMTSGLDQYLIVYVNDATEKYMIRKIQSIISNTQLSIDVPSDYTNTAAQFVRSPVAIKYDVSSTKMFGKKKDMLVLTESNANSTFRFVNNTVESVTITFGGSGYANGDILKVEATGTDSANALATVTTNATGGVTSLSWTNNGIGINTSPTTTIANSTGGATGGSGATFTYGIGATLLNHRSGAKYANVTLINYDFNAIRWAGQVREYKGSKYTVQQRWRYYHTGNTFSPQVHSDRKIIDLNKLDRIPIITNQTPLMLSHSNRAIQGDKDIANSVWDSVETVITVSANNNYSVPPVKRPQWYLYKFAINNDYTNENTRYGNAISKHLTNKVNFDEGRFADDLIVYVRAQRPANTNIKVFCKLHNSQDPEAFDDKDWTLMTCTQGANQVSSATNIDDIFEFTYELPRSPNTALTSAGSIETTNESAVIQGTGTSFNTDFASNNLVLVYNQLFPENYLIGVVNTVTNSTHLVLDEPLVGNNSIIGTGFKIARIDFKQQAFRNLQNDNTVRYYSKSMAEYDTFDTFALKIVMLSPSPAIVPSLDDVRAVGVSA